MAEIKTKQTDESVHDFIMRFADTPQKQKDSFELLELFQKYSGFEPKMWGPSIIGFGMYHYKSDRSKQEGDWPMVGFSPRKAAISLYIFSGLPEHRPLLDQLGKFKMGKACIYIKKRADINEDALKQLIEGSINHLTKKYG